MKIAFTTKGKSWDSMMDPRFGRTEFIMLYDDQTGDVSYYDNCSSANDAHGAGPKTAQALFEMDPDVLITGNGPGGNAAEVLKKAEIKVYVGAGEITAAEAMDAFNLDKLDEFVF